MKIFISLFAFLIGFAYADVNQELICPKGCKRKGNLIKCPIRKYNAGKIYDLDRKLKYEYFPKSEGQTEMAAVGKCKNILTIPSEEWMKSHNIEDYNDAYEVMVAAINTRDFVFICEDEVPIKEFFCQENKRDVLIVKYDDLGIEDERIVTTTDNPRYCKEKFDKKFR